MVWFDLVWFGVVWFGLWCFMKKFQGRQPLVRRISSQYSSLQAALLVLVIYYVVFCFVLFCFVLVWLSFDFELGWTGSV